jgi:hypothetical protein
MILRGVFYFLKLFLPVFAADILSVLACGGCGTVYHEGSCYSPLLFQCSQGEIIRYTHKTSGFKTSGFKTSGFKTTSFKMSGLQNVRFTKRQVSKRLVSKRPVFKFDILIKQKVLELPSLHFYLK